MTGPKLTVLAIDDNQDNLTILEALVADAFPGTRVLTALGGRKGIELAMAEDPDVILLDIVMPGMDGFAVCRELKAGERSRLIPVVFVTALKTGSASRVAALEAGAEAFLTKPIDAAELTAQVRAMTKVKAANLLERREKERLAALVAERTSELERELAERQRAEEEREKLQLQLSQAQKMESIGRLAGGVAHDFNNLLTVINGYSALLLNEMQDGDPRRPAVEEIHKAGDRAAGLVRQLLAFSRKQVLQPEVLDLNGVAEEMEEMLRRLVGEDIEVVTRLAPALKMVMADRHQVEQVIMNLAANARDAMPGGGTLTLETGHLDLSGTCPSCQCAILPGTYVELIVRDTGTGIDGHTRAHLFEPFFTTKGVGKGTGLGLATVLGIVLQSGGHIEVKSEAGKGSAFHVYFPVVERAPEETGQPCLAGAVGGSETILLVEDETKVRQFAATVLESYGYRVLPVPGGEEALAAFAVQPVDLLLTDMVMPRMSGVDLARRARALRPGLKTLFMSGYAGPILERSGEDLGGEMFLSKPFSPEALAAKVREALGKTATRILVVDDEEGVRKLLRTVLEKAGYAVSEAADGKQAMRCLDSTRAGLVITDLVMPEQEGIETIQAIRRDHPQVRIIAISGAGGGSYLPMAGPLGADAALAKPVSPERLLAEVGRVLQSHG